MATSKPDLYRELEDIVMCPMCLDRCTNPKSLPCLHTFCCHCLDQLIENSGQSGAFLCPTCRNEVQVPAGGANSFPATFFWKSLSGTVDKFKELGLHEKPWCTFCQEDGKQTNAETLCTDCMQTFCGGCLKYHNKITTNHNLVPCENIQAKDLNAILKAKDEVCPKHPEHKICLYCETCCELVCMMCAVVEHASHTKQELVTVEATHRDSLQKEHDSMKERVQHYDACIQRVIQAQKTCETGADEMVKIAEKHGKELMQTLQSFIQQLTTEIRTEAKKSVNNLKSLQKTLETEQLRFKECVSRSARSLKHGNAPTVLKTSIKETPTYKKMLRDLQPSHPLPILTFDLDLFDIKQLTRDQIIGQVKCKLQNESFRQHGATHVSVLLGSPGNIRPKKVGEFKVPLNPWSVSTTPDDNIVVCDNSTSSSQVLVYKPNGTILTQLQTPPGTQAKGVHCVDTDILVTDANTKSILVFDKNGSQTRTIPVGFEGSAGICVQDDGLFVTSGYDNKVYKLQWPSGSSKQVFAQHTSRVPLQAPYFVSANMTHVAVSCLGNALVQVFDKSGQLHYTYTGQGSPNELGSPYGVVIDCNNTMFVSDYGNHCIHIVSGQGQFMGQVDLYKDQLSYPMGLAINSQGQLVIAAYDCKTVATYTFQ